MALILENRDIFSLVVSNWLTLKDWGHLDTAMCSKELREIYLSYLHSVPFKLPDGIELNWKKHQSCLQWFAQRHINESRGQLNVHQNLWEKLLSSTEVDYRFFLRGVRNLRFLGFSSDFDFHGVAECSKLTQLSLCSVLGAVPSQNKIPSSLEILHLQNCKIDGNLVAVFSSCQNLKILRLEYVEFLFNKEGNSGVTSTKSSFISFLQQIQHLSVLGELNVFLDIVKDMKTSVLSVSLDRANKNEPETGALYTFLRNCTSCRELTLSRMKVDIMKILSSLSLSTSPMNSLSLNNVRMVNEMDLVTNPSNAHELGRLAINKLFLSSLVFLDDNILENLITILKAHGSPLREVTFSFCSKITDAAYVLLAINYPHLSSVEIEDRKDFWNENRIQHISTLFSNVPKLLIVAWDLWVLESEKRNLSTSKKVLFERGT
jgi:hypothetical protein